MIIIRGLGYAQTQVRFNTFSPRNPKHTPPMREILPQCCSCVSCLKADSGLWLFQNTYNAKPLENFVCMRRIRKFVGKVLSGPMLIVGASSPKPGGGDVIDDTLVGYP